MKNFLLMIPIFFILTSCASYISKMQNQISKEEAENHFNNRPNLPSKIDEFRNPNLVYQNGKNRSAKTSKEYLPTVKRQYRSSGKKRYSVDDLVDNDSDGSLWSGAGQDNFLFSRNSFKKNGDIVVIKVLQSLKDEIKIELARSTPEKPKKLPEAEPEPKTEGKEGDKAKAEKTKPKPKEAAAEETAKNLEKTDDGDLVYDKVSAMVIEEINKDHILIRGRKDVLYKTQKRTVEIQMLITRKDINDEDAVLSSKSLETTVSILR